MNIIPKLNLNKTPKILPSGSIVADKNIMCDDTGAFFTNDEGFSVAFECPNAGEFIVGCIPCGDRVVVFTYNSSSYESNVYVKYDDSEKPIAKIDCGWTWSGGRITGSYTFNYKKQLIIAVGEYDAYDEGGNIIDVPLKSWNIDKDTEPSIQNIEAVIPKFNCLFDLIQGGSLACGTYQYFIRFLIDDYNYTKWFEITDEIIVTNNKKTDAITHTYVYINSSNNISKKHVGTSGIIVNDPDKYSNYGISLKFKFLQNPMYKKFQLGYIIKHNSEVLARIENTYNITSTNINIVNNSFLEEIGVDELLVQPHQYYNVKNVINYNNRLYISNYKEYPLDNLENIVQDNVTISASANTVTQTSDEQYNVITLDLRNNGVTQNTIHANEISIYKESGRVFISNPEAFIKNYIAANTYYTDYIGTVVQRSAIEKNNKAKYIYFNANDVLIRVFAQNDNPYITDNSVAPYKLEIYNGVLYIVYSGTRYPINNMKYELLVTRTYKGKAYSRWVNCSSTDTKGSQTSIPVPSYPTSSTRTLSSVLSKKTEITSTGISNQKTFIPFQVYNLFVHFIRRDFSCTPGYKVRPSSGHTLYTVHTNNNGDAYFKFKNVSGNYIKPLIEFDGSLDEYIGYFISYEKVERTIIPLICTKIGDNDGSAYFCFTNNNFVYNLETIAGNRLLKSDGTVLKDNVQFTYSGESGTSVVSIHYNNEIQHYIYVTDITGVSEGNICYLEIDNGAVYKNEAKTLFRLTPNVFFNVPQERQTDKYLPGFYGRSAIPWYNERLLLHPTTNCVLNTSGVLVEDYTFNFKTSNCFSDKPIYAFSVKKKLTEGSVSLTNTDGKSIGTYLNRVLLPTDCDDFLELRACYTSGPTKSYSNYSDRFVNEFNQTIRRSDVITDESLVNNFRNFDLDNYRNIFENKGAITNIVGVYLYLIVHTEHSIFMFDRSPKLTSKSQLDIPDTFDVSYQEILSSAEGFGGLRDKDEAILTKNGYIWFDKTNNIIFNFENGKVEVISSDINNFLKALDIKNIRFAEDIIQNRLLCCIYLNETYTKTVDDKTYTKNKVLTLSYNFNTKTFISLHDYSFTDNYVTYNNSYVFNKYNDRKRLYKFDKSSVNYYNLINDNTIYFD